MRPPRNKIPAAAVFDQGLVHALGVSAFARWLSCYHCSMSTTWLARSLLFLSLLALSGGIAAAQNTAEAVQALQNQILSDPQLSGQIHSLSDNPEIRKVLADPAVAAAVQRGDYGALLANPKIRQLADDPSIQSLTRQLVAPK